MQSLIDPGMLEVMRELAKQAPEGCFVEVGVYRGGSAKVLYEVAQEQGRELYLYDTFAGIPMKGEFDQHNAGDFADCSYDEVVAAFPAANVIRGVFPDSMVRMPKVAFVHADADQYESTKNICLSLSPQMARGGMMLFDDYHALASCVKAVDECFPNRQILADRRALVRFP